MNIVRCGRPRVAEFWFDEPTEVLGIDMAILRQFRVLPRDSRFVKPFQTLIVDLLQDADAIFAGLNKETRQEIRRASGKDLLTHEVFENPSPECIARFCAAHERFARSKQLQPATAALLMSHAAAGSLRLARVASQGEALAWHSFVVIGGRARGLHCAPEPRSQDKARAHLVGRANRFMHWRNMLHFKRCGLSAYDLGGWYGGTDSNSLGGVNQFKNCFGGTVVTEFNGVLPLGWLGHVYMRVKHGSRLSAV